MAVKFKAEEADTVIGDVEIILDDDPDELHVDSYGIAINVPDGEMRIRFYDADENVMSEFITDAAGAYEFAQRILRSYDKLEGI